MVRVPVWEQSVSDLPGASKTPYATPETFGSQIGEAKASAGRAVAAGLESLGGALTAQYEQARIQEVRDVPTLEALDVATPPERKSRPKRGLLVLTGMMLGFGAGVALALTARATPEPA